MSVFSGNQISIQLNFQLTHSGMEILSVKHMISTTQSAFPVRYSTNPIHIRRFSTHFPHFRLVPYSKKWDFQDFRGYAKPSRLFPAKQIEFSAGFSLQKALSSIKTSSSDSLYIVKLQTSKLYGSGLTDMNSGVLLCFIDENGYSILQRIPASCVKDLPFQSEKNSIYDGSPFQRGSIGEFIFDGPSLGKIAAVWIGVESGQWRLGGVSLTVICQHQSPLTEDVKANNECIAFRYNFQMDDILLGEGTDVSMVELRPSSISELSEDSEIFLDENSSNSSSLGTYVASNEESMKNYADLKFSLLLYDAMLILAGSSIASFSAGENAAYAFLVGGLGGFLYLLLLQRSVDGLPSSELISRRSTGNVLGKLRGPVSSLVLAFVFSIVAAKYASGASDRILTPQELLSGMMGFLMCKVAVVLAAFKPMPWYLRENK